MKISVMGYSGSGKSTLARKLGEENGLDVLHLDTVNFLPGWELRTREEKDRLIRAFLDSHDAWVIDGNYTRFYLDRRLEESDAIVLMLFGRFACLWRVWRRYRRYRGGSRPDMAEGCSEKLDFEFVRWVLWEGRTRRIREIHRRIIRDYPDKVTVIRNQRQLDAYMKKIS